MDFVERPSVGGSEEPDPDQVTNAMNAFFPTRTLAQLYAVVEAHPVLLTETVRTGLRNLVTMLGQQGHPNAAGYMQHVEALDQLAGGSKPLAKEEIPPEVQRAITARRALDALEPDARARVILEQMLKGSPVALEPEDIGSRLFMVLAEMLAQATPGSDDEQRLERLAERLRQFALQARAHRRMEDGR